MQNIKYKMQNSTYKTQNREILENGEKGVESVNTLGNKGEPTTRGTKQTLNDISHTTTGGAFRS